MTEGRATARSTPAELTNGRRDHQPRPTKGTANLRCCAARHRPGTAVSTHTLRTWGQPREAFLGTDSSDGGGGRAQSFRSFQALASFRGPTTCINRYGAQHPTLCLFPSRTAAHPTTTGG